MIEIKEVTKTFDTIKALDHVSVNIEDGQVFGLIGTNGAGKSTLMRMICGVYQPDTGTVTIDQEKVFDNPLIKSQIFYISDDQFFQNNGTPMDMMNFYQVYYPDFDRKRFLELLAVLNLEESRKINTFSKGMKKQLSILYGICSGSKYLLCDETFDGLDPVIRQAVKSLFIHEMEERNMTPIIASHNLRELEDICDHIGLLYNGGILLSKELDEMKLGIHKLQLVLEQEGDYEKLSSAFTILKKETRGSLITLTLRGERDKLEAVMSTVPTVFYEILPLSLEEIFISETEVIGYDFKNIIF